MDFGLGRVCITSYVPQNDTYYSFVLDVSLIPSLLVQFSEHAGEHGYVLTFYHGDNDGPIPTESAWA
jgi:hypothetical protein